MSRPKSQATIEREAERAERRRRRDLRRAEQDRRRAERDARRARHALATSRPTPRVTSAPSYLADGGPSRYICACARCHTFFRSPDWADDLCESCRVDDGYGLQTLEFADFELPDPGPLFQR